MTNALIHLVAFENREIQAVLKRKDTEDCQKDHGNGSATPNRQIHTQAYEQEYDEEKHEQMRWDDQDAVRLAHPPKQGARSSDRGKRCGDCQLSVGESCCRKRCRHNKSSNQI